MSLDGRVREDPKWSGLARDARAVAVELFLLADDFLPEGSIEINVFAAVARLSRCTLAEAVMM